MNIIKVKLAANAYPVYLGHGLLRDPDVWQRHLGTGKTLIVSNDVVAPLYLERLKNALGETRTDTLIIPDGEPFKTSETWYRIIDKLVSMQARRDATLIALGGGVVGDITGFAAASYMRGVRFIQAPTTLLAQVDASVGGKTGFNHEKGKNLVGAFHQPAAVMIDSATLETLEEREYRAGIAEVIKYGAIRDRGFFDWLEDNIDAINHRETPVLDELIHQSVSNKAEIVAEDEKEAGIRALLNFGHSFGHALEAQTGYSEFLHGEAVSIGMVIAARLSELRGLCVAGATERIISLLSRFSLPVSLPAETSMDGMLDALNLDKKANAAGLRLVLLTDIGQAVIDTESTREEILHIMRQSLDQNRPAP
ncbi:3-dehydroquinate synthase [Pseudomonadota bacterium]